MADLNKFAEELVNLSVKEANELATILKENYGIEAAAVAVPATSETEKETVQAEEKTNFDIILKSPGNTKLNVIKLIKSSLGFGLKEAKGLADSAPSTLKEGATKDEAENFKKQFEEAGAEIELK